MRRWTESSHKKLLQFRRRRSLIESGPRIAAPGTPGSAIPTELTGGRAIRLDHASLLRGEFQDLAATEMVMERFPSHPAA